MKRIMIILLSSLFVLFILVQFIRPEMISTNEMTAGDIRVHLQAPADVIAFMQESCYDCHSDNTVWPWYSKVAPASWLMARDVRGGREHLNLSHWDELETTERIMMLQLMCREVETGEMPLKQYIIMHRNARVTETEESMFCDWAQKEAAALQTGR